MAGQGPSGALGALSGKALCVLSCSLPWDPRDLQHMVMARRQGPCTPQAPIRGDLNCATREARGPPQKGVVLGGCPLHPFR